MCFSLWQLYDKTRRVSRALLVDETDILKNYRTIVIAMPFRKRVIPIYWKIYEKDAFRRMVYPSHNVLVQEFCYQFIKQFENALPNVKRPTVWEKGHSSPALTSSQKASKKHYVQLALQKTGVNQNR